MKKIPKCDNGFRSTARQNGTRRAQPKLSAQMKKRAQDHKLRDCRDARVKPACPSFKHTAGEPLFKI